MKSLLEAAKSEEEEKNDDNDETKEFKDIIVDTSSTKVRSSWNWYIYDTPFEKMLITPSKPYLNGATLRGKNFFEMLLASWAEDKNRVKIFNAFNLLFIFWWLFCVMSLPIFNTIFR